MRAYQILPGDNIDGLQCVDFPERDLAPHEVRVRVHAVSLNYRDLMVASGNYLVNVDNPVVPCSDGAGEVLAVVRPWTVDDFTGIWWERARDGDPAAIASLLMIPLLAWWLASHAVRSSATESRSCAVRL